MGSTANLAQPSGGFGANSQSVANSGGTSSQTRIGGGFNSRQPVVNAEQRQGNPESSSDRMNTYQSKLSKLSSMREKFQQRKTLTGNDPPQTMAKASSVNQSAASGKQNLSTSFSALNNSLQMRWKQVQKKDSTTARESIGGEAQP